MNQTSLIVIIVVALIALAIVVVLRKRKAAAAATSGIAAPALASLDALAARLEAHIEKTNAAATDAVKARMQTVGNVVIQALGGQKMPTAGAPKAPATTTAAAPAAAASASPDAPAAASTAPAAPAQSAAVDPPPTVAPAAPPAAPAPSAGGSGTNTWPQMTTVDGVQYKLLAPLNAAYRPSMAARVLGKPPSFVGDPSNGNRCKPPQPLRTAEGYPLGYAIGADGAPVGTPSVLQGDQTFNSDAEVAAYNAATTPTAAQQAEAAAGWARLDAALQEQVRQAPPPTRTTLAAVYPSEPALTADIAALHFTGAVTVDGHVLNPGFGKPDGSAWAYVTEPDHTLKAA